jgi:hypothetical protein
VARKQIRVYKKFQKRAKTFIEVSEIRLVGKWLSKNGFLVGSIVSVSYAKNRIVISANNKTSYTSSESPEGDSEFSI